MTAPTPPPAGLDAALCALLRDVAAGLVFRVMRQRSGETFAMNERDWRRCTRPVRAAEAAGLIVLGERKPWPRQGDPLRWQLTDAGRAALEAAQEVP